MEGNDPDRTGQEGNCPFRSLTRAGNPSTTKTLPTASWLDWRIYSRFHTVCDKIFVREGIDALALYVCHGNITDGFRIKEKPILSMHDLETHLGQIKKSEVNNSFLQVIDRFKVNHLLF